jgi:multisubunit Na+/H+ antiporter MnhG subunit
LIFFAHISLFQAEDQYLDAFAMTNSIARYGAPFIMGAMYLIMGVALDRTSKEEKISRYTVTLAVIAAFILLTADYTGTFYALHGYRQEIATKMQYNSDMIDEGGQDFLATVSGEKSLRGHRVLNLRSSSYNHWVHDTYISKEASPVPVVYETLMEDDYLDSVTLKIKNSHAEYFYVEPQVVAEYDYLDEIVTDGESFETGRVYRVISDNNSIKLCATVAD